MTRATLQGHVHAADVDGPATESLLRRGAQRRAPIGLVLTGERLSRRLAGELLNLSDGRLEIRLESGESWRPCLTSASLIEARLELDGKRYVFGTRFAGWSSSHAGGVFYLEAPSALRISDRRRSPRRRFRRATSVTLRTDGSGPRRVAEGVLLNLSADGLACRIRRRDLQGVRPGLTVLTDFFAEGSAEPFTLSARIVSVIDASARHQKVLGLEFVNDQNHQRVRARLKKLLDAPRSPSDKRMDP